VGDTRGPFIQRLAASGGEAVTAQEFDRAWERLK